MAQFGGLYREEAKSVSGDHMDDEDVLLIEEDNQLLQTSSDVKLSQISSEWCKDDP